MGTVNGLPAHILLVHAIVVLLPLAALLLLTAVWPAIPVALLALVIWWRQREATPTADVRAPSGSGIATTTRRRTYLAPLSPAITAVIVVLAVGVGGWAGYDT